MKQNLSLIFSVLNSFHSDASDIEYKRPNRTGSDVTSALRHPTLVTQPLLYFKGSQVKKVGNHSARIKLTDGC